jgi:hypothetical protein
MGTDFICPSGREFFVVILSLPLSNVPAGQNLPAKYSFRMIAHFWYIQLLKISLPVPENVLYR